MQGVVAVTLSQADGNGCGLVHICFNEASFHKLGQRRVEEDRLSTCIKISS